MYAGETENDGLAGAVVRGLVIGICLFVVLGAGAFWIWSNASYSECQSVVFQAADGGTCGAVLTWHTPAGIAALLALIGAVVALVKR